MAPGARAGLVAVDRQQALQVLGSGSGKIHFCQHVATDLLDALQVEMSGCRMECGSHAICVFVG